MSEYTVTEVTERYRVSQSFQDGAYYVIVRDARDNGYKFEWNEPGETPDWGVAEWPTIAEALDHAAEDWGKSGSGSDGLTQRLRLAAARYRQGTFNG